MKDSFGKSTFIFQLQRGYYKLRGLLIIKIMFKIHKPFKTNKCQVNKEY